MSILSAILSRFTGHKAQDQLDPLDDRYYDPISNFLVMKRQKGTFDWAMREATVNSCVRIISDGVAQMDLNVMDTDKDGDKFIATGNPLYRVLKFKPNTWMDAYTYVRFNMVCLLLRGFFLSKKVYSNGKIIGLIPYHPDYVEIDQMPDGTLKFMAVSCQNVFQKKFNSKETFYSVDAYYCPFATFDGVNPVSPIKYASESIDLGNTMRTHGNAMFKNSAMPSGTLSTPETLDDKAYKRIRGSWQETYGGTKNAGKVAILEQDLKFNAISMSNEDAQYLESRQYTREEIAAIFGVPPHMVGDTAKAKGWSTIEQMASELLRWTFNPWIKRVEDASDIQLVPRGRWGITSIRFDTKELTRGNIKDRMEYYATGIDKGILSPNECREMEDLNPREGGDEYLTAMNMSSTNEPEEEPEEEIEDDDASDDNEQAE